DRQGCLSSVLIKFRSVSGVLRQNFARREFVLGLCKSLHFANNLFQSEMFCETQWPATEWRETSPQDHSVICILRRLDNFLFHTARRFVDNEKDQPVDQFVFIQLQTGVAVPVWRNVRSLCSFGFAMHPAPPLQERLVRPLCFAFIFVKTPTAFA